jgi:hypothetical protein
LSTGGDGVNLFDSTGVVRASVSFGVSPTSPLATFDNTFGLNNTTISELSVVGIHGASQAVNSTNEIGSPGLGSKVIVSEVAPWSSGSSPVAADWFELSNVGATPVDVTGWKMDDNSQSPAGAVLLTGVTNIAPGESVIFIETATLETTKSNYLANWFGTNSPVDLQVGAYSGSGISLSSGGDGVTVYTSNNVLMAVVTFGPSPSGPYPTFDNAVGLDGLASASITNLSVVGTNGAFVAVNSSSEIGSPGILTVPVLSLTTSGSDAILSWTVDSVGYRLQDTLALENPNGWTNSLPSVLTNGRRGATATLTNNAQFFRLKK